MKRICSNMGLITSPIEVLHSLGQTLGTYLFFSFIWNSVVECLSALLPIDYNIHKFKEFLKQRIIRGNIFKVIKR